MLDQAISVAGLTEYLQLLIEDDDRLRQVWVVGEISSTSPHRSGMFFALQDPDGKAMINCVAWASQLAKFAAKPQKGEQVILLGAIKLYPGQGRYQLTVWQCLPAGEGLQALRDRQLKQRLESEGLFDPDTKMTLPAHPQTVAVVTSANAAAWGDIQRTLGIRYPGLRVLLSPAIVQGEQAPKSIVQAIDRVVRDGRAEVLILARGGGATEDLACFNQEIVVRAIATCPIPVITGIGHERDESLADLVADHCAHTPTAAAARSVPDLDELYDAHRDRVMGLQIMVQQRLRQETEKIEFLQSRLARVKPDRLLLQEKQKLNWLKQSLIQQMRSRMAQAQAQQQLLQEKASSLDPAAVLQRGYAVLRAEGAIVRDGADLTVGQTVEIQLGRGKVRSIVEEILP
jgi:exodeoxyribonuclease VII large subunit